MTDFQRINFTFSFFPGKVNFNCYSHFGSPEAFKVFRREFPEGPNSSEYFYNSSEPCHPNETAGEHGSEGTQSQTGSHGVSGDHKENHGSEGTQSQTGSQGGTVGHKVNLGSEGTQSQTGSQGVSGGDKENHGSEGTQRQTANQGESSGGKGIDASSAKLATQKHPVQLVYVPIPEPAGNTQQPQPAILMAPPSGVVAPAQLPLASAGPAPSNTVQSNAGSPSTSSKVTPTVQTGMQREREREGVEKLGRKRGRRREGENEEREEGEMKGEKKVEWEIGKWEG